MATSPDIPVASFVGDPPALATLQPAPGSADNAWLSPGHSAPAGQAASLGGAGRTGPAAVPSGGVPVPGQPAIRRQMVTGFRER